MKELSTQNFNQTLQENQFVLVDFWAPWCGPCKSLAPVLEGLEKDYVGKIIFTKLDIDKNQEIAMDLRIFSIPNVGIFKDGKLVGSLVGFRPKKDFVKFIDEQLKK